jgi:signal transduction histidine kinase
MEAIFDSPAVGEADALPPLRAAARRGILPVRFSSLVINAYVLLHGSLLFLNQVDDSLAYVSIVAPLIVCLLYVYFFRCEEKRQSVSAARRLAARADELARELEQRAAERVLLLEELERQKERLAKAQRVKDQFLGILSHELRTPLNVVMGYARLLKERMLGDLDTIQAEAIAKIVAHTRDQLAMITDMLEITSLNSGDAAPHNQEIALGGLLADLQSDHDVCERKSIRMVWDYAEDLPIVKTDGEKLKHLLRNLVDNAIKFTPQGSVTVSARLMPPCEAVPGKQCIEFRVADTGIGIAAEHLPRIFDRFQQVDSSNTRTFGGVGMGLYVVKRLAEVLGATVTVKSARDVGSVFTVALGCDLAAEGRFKRNARTMHPISEMRA